MLHGLGGNLVARFVPQMPALSYIVSAWTTDHMADSDPPSGGRKRAGLIVQTCVTVKVMSDGFLSNGVHCLSSYEHEALRARRKKQHSTYLLSDVFTHTS